MILLDTAPVVALCDPRDGVIAQFSVRGYRSGDEGRLWMEVFD